MVNNLYEFYRFFTEHFLKNEIYYDTWCRQLEAQGWKRKGEGAYGVAYVHPNKNYVYKLFRNDPGYEFFLEFALANQNDPNVVRVKRVILKGLGPGPNENYLGNNTIPNVIAIEKLSPLDMKKNSSRLIFNVSHYILTAMKKVYKSGMPFEEAVKELLEYARKRYEEDYSLYGDKKDVLVKRWRTMIHLFDSPLVYKLPIFRTMYNLFIYKEEKNAEFIGICTLVI